MIYQLLTLIEFNIYNCFFFQMEIDLGTEKYQELWQIVEKYGNDEDYASYRNSLFEIFKDKCWTYNLKGMIFFTKPIHRENFENDIKAFIQSRE